MKKLALIPVLAGLFIIGCGGAGDTGKLPSLYLGAWSGNWTSPDANDGGAITLTVATDGSFTGTIASKFGSGGFSGLIDKNGKLTGIGSFTGGANMVIGGMVTMASGRISSNFSYTQMGIQYGGSFDCGAASSGTTGSTGSTGSTGG